MNRQICRNILMLTLLLAIKAFLLLDILHVFRLKVI